jgi:hypothetical protein
MTDEERQMLSEVHGFLFRKEYASKPTRAEQLDKLLSGVATGKMTVRAALWVAGALVAVGAAISQVKGWGWFK